MPSLEDINATNSRLRDTHNELETYRTNNLNKDVTQLNTLFNDYIKTAGSDSSKMLGDSGALAVVSRINDKYTAYNALIKNKSELIKSLSEQSDIGTRLNDVGTKQKKIALLKKEIAEIEDRVDTGEERKQLIETRTNTASYSQLFGGIERPLKDTALPILLTLSFIFLMGGIYALSTFFPGIGNIISGIKLPSQVSTIQGEGLSVTSILLSPYVLITIIVSLSVGFGVYALKYNNKI